MFFHTLESLFINMRCLIFIKTFRRRTLVYQGVRNVSFSENFVYVPIEWSRSTCTEYCEKILFPPNTHSYIRLYIWNKVFKNRPSEICGRLPLKNLTWYGLLNSNFLMAVFHKFNLVHSWILCPINNFSKCKLLGTML